MPQKPRPVKHEIHEYLASQLSGASHTSTDARTMDSAGLDALLHPAEQALAEAESDAAARPTPKPFHLRNFGATRTDSQHVTSELNRDVDLDLKIELGRTRLTLEEASGLSQGSMLVLDKLSGDPVDVLVDGRLIARGQVLVLNDKFCVRVTELLDSTPFA